MAIKLQGYFVIVWPRQLVNGNAIAISGVDLHRDVHFESRARKIVVK